MFVSPQTSSTSLRVRTIFSSSVPEVWPFSPSSSVLYGMVSTLTAKERHLKYNYQNKNTEVQQIEVKEIPLRL